MTIYYADVSTSSTGGDGTIGNPWDRETFKAMLAGATLLGTDTVNVKGSLYDELGTITIDAATPGLIVKNWESEPWRVHSQEFHVQSGCKIYNTIINADDIYTETGEVYGCLLYGGSNIYVDNVTQKGCTLVTPLLTGGCIGEVHQYDCVIDAIGYSGFDSSYTSDHCVFSAAVPAVGTHTDYQESWTPPAWPAWNAIKELFLKTILLTGVVIPPRPGVSPYTGYEATAWGTTREDIGFYYGIGVTYYANLDIGGTGGDGTYGDPWYADTFKAMMEGATLLGTDVVNVKGSYEYTGTMTIDAATPGLVVQNWDNTPWRVKGTTFQVQSGCKVYNAIVEAEDIRTITSEVYGCLLYGTANLYVDDVIQKGCTLVTPILAGECIGEVHQYDCVIDAGAYSGFDSSYTSDHCVFSAAVPAAGTHTDYQESWTPPSWPAWNAAKEAFLKTIVLDGVSNPPSPGVSPYTGYDTLAWGNPRDDIGFYYDIEKICAWRLYTGTDEQVKSSYTDPAAGYLVDKLEAGIAMAIGETMDTHRMKFDVQLGTQSDQAAAGNDSRFGKVLMTLSDQSAAYYDPILYGTGDPPDPTGLSEGTLYIKYSLPE
jgi:hypothetical protein